MGDFGVNYTARYYSGLKESCVPTALHRTRPLRQRRTDPLRKTGCNTFHDLQVRWKAPWDATMRWARTTCSITRVR